MATAVRVRSPNYPVVSLSEAVQKIRMVYAQEHMHPASRETVAKVLGYSGLNGASAGVVSALVKFGLMEQVGADQIKVSADGQDVIVHRKGDPEYAKVIERSAFRPTLFSELHDLYGMNLPSDHSLRANLQKRGFNPKVVDSVIRLYRDTIEFVESETEGFDTPQLDEAMEEMPVQPTPTEGSAASLMPGSFSLGSRNPATSTPPIPSVTAIEVSIPITISQTVRVIASSPLDEAGWKRFLAGVDFMKPGLVALEPPATAPASATTPAPVSLPPIVTTSTLTDEALELLKKVGGGGVPAYTTRNLERIAGENGVEVVPGMTP
ncbi:MAG: hypothetical protein ACYDCQ_18005, partial [Dehalococcoidia bacterium]